MERTRGYEERAINYGMSALTNQELMALIIQGGNKAGDSMKLAETVMDYYGANSGELNRASAKELSQMTGIGKKKACAIAGAIELGKRMCSDYISRQRIVIRDSADVADLLMPELMYEKREHVIALLLNVKGELESQEVISIGELAATNIHPREVFNPAVRKSAAGIVVVHNHPSGDPTPSEEDLIATRRLLEASKIIGINLVDHVIIGNGSYISLRAEGVI